MKRKLFVILERPAESGVPGRIFNLSILALIALNVLAMILETVRSLAESAGAFFHGFEALSVAVFTVEYLARLWVCTLDPRYRHPVLGRVRFALTPMALVDLLAILPFYLPTDIDLRSGRILRLFRLFRIIKLGRYSESLKSFAIVLREKREEILITLFLVLVALVLSSSVMYYVENDAQPEAFSSIPASMWWGIATLTTVGYGDIYPQTPLGKFCGSLIAILGIGLFALPAGILGSGFVELIHRRKGSRRLCPHCGKDPEEPPGTSAPPG